MAGVFSRPGGRSSRPRTRGSGAWARHPDHHLQKGSSEPRMKRLHRAGCDEDILGPIRPGDVEEMELTRSEGIDGHRGGFLQKQVGWDREGRGVKRESETGCLHDGLLPAPETKESVPIEIMSGVDRLFVFQTGQPAQGQGGAIG